MRFDGTSLIYPHVTTARPLDRSTARPIEQARRHAAFLEEVIRKKLGFSWPVKSVVALPGWFVSIESERPSDVLVSNPKRSKALERWLGDARDREKRNRVLQYIESVARSVTPKSKLTDPDAERSYDFWFDPRYRERRIGDE